MMTNLKKSLLTSCLLLFVFSFQAYAQLRMPTHFSDHMVLQRETHVAIWGWAPAGTEVKLNGSWSADTVKAKSNGDGKWEAKLSTATAGGPYELHIASRSESIRLKDVLLGDVYLCSGQSNMEWGGNQKLPEILEELPHANNPNIRFLQVSRYAADAPQENIHNHWTEVNEKTLRAFSAIGYFIAKKLNVETGVPIGVINSSWGGTGAEVWTPKELIESDKQLLDLSAMQQANDYRPHGNGVLWNGMIAPLVPYTIKAAFWYQGESNVGSWKGYDKLMQGMIGSWRKAWEADFPFYFVQIAPFAYKNKDLPKAAFLREQQSLTAVNLSKTGMTVVTDLVDNIDDIHPVQKRAVADRLADLALVEVYNKSIKDYKSPIYKSQQVKGDKVEIDFHYTEGDLICKDKNVSDIYIAGSDQVFHPATASIAGRKLIVSSKLVKNPVAVRFGFTEIAMPNLFNARGLPVSPFRTDNWEL